MPTSGQARVAPDELRSLVVDCFVGLGLSGDDAGAVAEALLYADMRGLEAHGVHRVPVYMQRVRLGLAGGAEALREVAGSGALRRLDAGHALGPAAAVRACDLAVELAREHGIALVAVGRSTHFGAAGLYARRAAREGMVALVTSNGPAAVAPFGATEAFIGTNPLAVGIPTPSHGELVLDMSTSAIPRERIRRAAAAGQELPVGVALDGEGRPTTDPSAALAGSALPVGGAKGSGLGLAIGLLAGMLAAAQFDHQIGSMERDLDRPQNVGQLFATLDPSRLVDPRETAPGVDGLLDALHALRPAEGFEFVAFSGESGDAKARASEHEGIALERSTLARIATACAEAQLPELAERARRLAA